jgi:hypothetical protein
MQATLCYLVHCCWFLFEFLYIYRYSQGSNKIGGLQLIIVPLIIIVQQSIIISRCGGMFKTLMQHKFKWLKVCFRPFLFIYLLQKIKIS